MFKTFFTTLMLASYAVLVGCGTTGPLYIPEQRYPQKTQDETPTQPDVSPADQPTEE